MIEILKDALLDSLKLIPFLFLAYLLLEYIEHKMGDRSKQKIRQSGKWGPVIGSLLGVIPQCGFSAAASNLYVGHIITTGTLLAVYLSTSDEMLPIMISEAASPMLIFKLLALKVVIGMIAGGLIDLLIPRKIETVHVHDMCDHDHCHCRDNEGILKPAVYHTASITAFLFVVTWLIDLMVEYGQGTVLSALSLNRPVTGVLLAGLIGLIPNCAASVALTKLYLEGMMGFGALLTGLLVGAGIGLLVLFRENRRHLKDNLKILALLYILGIIPGLLISIFG